MILLSNMLKVWIVIAISSYCRESLWILKALLYIIIHIPEDHSCSILLSSFENSQSLLLKYTLLIRYLHLKPRTLGNSFLKPHFRLEDLSLNWLMNSVWCLMLAGSSNMVEAALCYSESTSHKSWAKAGIPALPSTPRNAKFLQLVDSG